MDTVIFQKISKRSPHTTVMALENKVILDFENIPPSLILVLFTITAVRTSKVVEGIFFL
jgi:hypothetical protein